MTTRAEVSQLALAHIGKPATPQNVLVMVAWATGENTTAENNPWATTEPGEPGETEFNSAGVKNYPTLEEGLDAFARTIALPEYGAIRELLADGSSPDRVAAAIAASPWGTHDVVAALADVRNDPALADVEIAGGAPTPEPEPKPAAPPAAKPETPAPAPVTGAHNFTVPQLVRNDTAKPAEDVASAQLLLRGRGNPTLAVDGLFGPATLAAVEAFQRANGLSVDGIVGPHSWGALLGCPQ